MKTSFHISKMLKAFFRRLAALSIATTFSSTTLSASFFATAVVASTGLCMAEDTTPIEVYASASISDSAYVTLASLYATSSEDLNILFNLDIENNLRFGAAVYVESSNTSITGDINVSASSEIITSQSPNYRLYGVYISYGSTCIASNISVTNAYGSSFGVFTNKGPLSFDGNLSISAGTAIYYHQSDTMTWNGTGTVNLSGVIDIQATGFEIQSGHYVLCDNNASETILIADTDSDSLTIKAGAKLTLAGATTVLSSSTIYTAGGTYSDDYLLSLTLDTDGWEADMSPMLSIADGCEVSGLKQINIINLDSEVSDYSAYISDEGGALTGMLYYLYTGSLDEGYYAIAGEAVANTSTQSGYLYRISADYQDVESFSTDIIATTDFTDSAEKALGTALYITSDEAQSYSFGTLYSDVSMSASHAGASNAAYGVYVYGKVGEIAGNITVSSDGGKTVGLNMSHFDSSGADSVDTLSGNVTASGGDTNIAINNDRDSDLTFAAGVTITAGVGTSSAGKFYTNSGSYALMSSTDFTLSTQNADDTVYIVGDIIMSNGTQSTTMNLTLASGIYKISNNYADLGTTIAVSTLSINENAQLALTEDTQFIALESSNALGTVSLVLNAGAGTNTLLAITDGASVSGLTNISIYTDSEITDTSSIISDDGNALLGTNIYLYLDGESDYYGITSTYTASSSLEDAMLVLFEGESSSSDLTLNTIMGDGTSEAWALAVYTNEAANTISGNITVTGGANDDTTKSDNNKAVGVYLGDEGSATISANITVTNDYGSAYAIYSDADTITFGDGASLNAADAIYSQGTLSLEATASTDKIAITGDITAEGDSLDFVSGQYELTDSTISATSLTISSDASLTLLGDVAFDVDSISLDVANLSSATTMLDLSKVSSLPSLDTITIELSSDDYKVWDAKYLSTLISVSDIYLNSLTYVVTDGASILHYGYVDATVGMMPTSALLTISDGEDVKLTDSLEAVIDYDGNNGSVGAGLFNNASSIDLITGDISVSTIQSDERESGNTVYGIYNAGNQIYGDGVLVEIIAEIGTISGNITVDAGDVNATGLHSALYSFVYSISGDITVTGNLTNYAIFLNFDEGIQFDGDVCISASEGTSNYSIGSTNTLEVSTKGVNDEVTLNGDISIIQSTERKDLTFKIGNYLLSGNITAADVSIEEKVSLSLMKDTTFTVDSLTLNVGSTTNTLLTVADGTTITGLDSIDIVVKNGDAETKTFDYSPYISADASALYNIAIYFTEEGEDDAYGMTMDLTSTGNTSDAYATSNALNLGAGDSVDLTMLVDTFYEADKNRYAAIYVSGDATSIAGDISITTADSQSSDTYTSGVYVADSGSLDSISATITASSNSGTVYGVYLGADNSLGSLSGSISAISSTESYAIWMDITAASTLCFNGNTTLSATGAADGKNYAIYGSGGALELKAEDSEGTAVDATISLTGDVTSSNNDLNFTSGTYQWTEQVDSNGDSMLTTISAGALTISSDASLVLCDNTNITVNSLTIDITGDATATGLLLLTEDTTMTIGDKTITVVVDADTYALFDSDSPYALELIYDDDLDDSIWNSEVYKYVISCTGKTDLTVNYDQIAYGFPFIYATTDWSIDEPYAVKLDSTYNDTTYDADLEESISFANQVDEAAYSGATLYNEANLTALTGSIKLTDDTSKGGELSEYNFAYGVYSVGDIASMEANIEVTNSIGNAIGIYNAGELSMNVDTISASGSLISCAIWNNSEETLNFAKDITLSATGGSTANYAIYSDSDLSMTSVGTVTMQGDLNAGANSIALNSGSYQFDNGSATTTITAGNMRIAAGASMTLSGEVNFAFSDGTLTLYVTELNATSLDLSAVTSLTGLDTINVVLSEELFDEWDINSELSFIEGAGELLKDTSYYIYDGILGSEDVYFVDTAFAEFSVDFTQGENASLITSDSTGSDLTLNVLSTLDFTTTGYATALYNTGTLGEISGDFVVVGADSTRSSNLGYAIYNIGETGNVTGSISITNEGGSAYAIYNKGIMGNITGAELSTTGTSAYGLCVYYGANASAGELSSKVTAIATDGMAYGVYLDMECEMGAISSESITVCATNNAYGVYTDSGSTVAGNISSTFDVDSSEGEAYGLSLGATLTGNFTGSMDVTSETSKAWGILLRGSMGDIAGDGITVTGASSYGLYIYNGSSAATLSADVSTTATNGPAYGVNLEGELGDISCESISTTSQTAAATALNIASTATVGSISGTISAVGVTTATAINYAGAAALNFGDSVTLSATGAESNYAINAANSLTMTSTGTVSMTGDLSAGGDITLSSGAYTLETATTVTADSMSIAAGASLTLLGDTSFDFSDGTLTLYVTDLDATSLDLSAISSVTGLDTINVVLSDELFDAWNIDSELSFIADANSLLSDTTYYLYDQALSGDYIILDTAVSNGEHEPTENNSALSVPGTGDQLTDNDLLQDVFVQLDFSESNDIAAAVNNTGTLGDISSNIEAKGTELGGGIALYNAGTVGELNGDITITMEDGFAVALMRAEGSSNGTISGNITAIGGVISRGIYNSDESAIVFGDGASVSASGASSANYAIYSETDLTIEASAASDELSLTGDIYSNGAFYIGQGVYSIDTDTITADSVTLSNDANVTLTGDTAINSEDGTLSIEEGATLTAMGELNTGALSLTNGTANLTDANLTLLLGDADSSLSGSINIEGEEESLYEGSYAGATGITLVGATTATLDAGADLSIIGSAESEVTITGASGGSLKSLNSEGTVNLGTMSESLTLGEASSLTESTLNVELTQATLSESLSSGNALSLTSGAALSISDSTLNISMADGEDNSLDLSIIKDTDNTLLSLSDNAESSVDATVNVEGYLFSKYFTNIRIEGHNVVADLNHNAYSSLVEGEGNHIAGMTLINEALISINPQLDDKREDNQDLAAVMDSMDEHLQTGNSAAASDLAAAVAGSSVTAMNSALMSDVDRQLGSIRNRMQEAALGQGMVPEQGASGFSAWVQAETAQSNLDNDAGYRSGHSYSASGGSVGADMIVSSNTVAGAAFTAMYGDVDSYVAGKSEGELDTYYLSAYARHQWGAWNHSIVASVGMANASMDRTLTHNSGSYTTKGDTDGFAFGLSYELAYDIALKEDKSTLLRPIFAASLIHSSLDGYSESGSDASLTVSKQDNTYMSIGAGLELARSIGTKIVNRNAQLNARALITADIGDRSVDADVALTNNSGTTDRIIGTKAGALGLELGVGLSVPVTSKGDAIFLNINYEVRENMTEGSATLGYRFQF